MGGIVLYLFFAEDHNGLINYMILRLYRSSAIASDFRYE